MNTACQLAVEGPIAKVTFNRPETLNSFDLEAARAFEQLLKSVSEREELRVLVIRGHGDVFCTGTDPGYFKELQDGNDSRTYKRLVEATGHCLVLLRRMPQWVIASVNGLATGGGLQLVLAADLAVASQLAYFADYSIRLGLHPDWGSYRLMPERLGAAKTLEILLQGKLMSAEEALRLSLVNEVVAPHRLDERTDELARRIAEAPPLVLRRLKRGILESRGLEFKKVVELEVEGQLRSFLSEDSREGREAFAKKRRPKFQGR
jgi:enoyl-CoA hydratase/carnithine racemase